MRRFAMMVATASLGSLLITNGASQAQAPNEMVRQYGYQFCAVIAQDLSGGRDCSFVTMEQCRAFASGMGYCLENSAYIAARENPQSLTRLAAPHKRR